MELRDFIVTPIFIIIVYAIAYVIRPRVTDDLTRVYFIPALTLKIVGALTVGIIYQFYYGGGDTFNYHTFGSRIVWEAFLDSPVKGFKLLFSDGIDQIDVYKYSSRIPFFGDENSYMIVRIATLIDLLTFSTYSATAIIFAVISFVGVWMFFLTFYKQYPWLHKSLAIAAFYIPSVFFWGSGLLKDTLTLGCLGIATYYIHALFIRWEKSFVTFIILLLALYGLYSIKVYILLVFLPAAILWVFLSNFQSISSTVLKMMVFPFVIVAAIACGYLAMMKAGEDNSRYTLDRLAITAQQTAYDIRYWTGGDAGSGYSLGELDGTWGSMLTLLPSAINVSLFRPYAWEVNNPLMLLASMESLCFLLFSLYILIRYNYKVIRVLTRPDIIFCVIFSISFAFGVGISTYNFGTLVRYKIPMLPFFLVALVLIKEYAARTSDDDGERVLAASHISAKKA